MGELKAVDEVDNAAVVDMMYLAKAKQDRRRSQIGAKSNIDQWQRPGISVSYVEFMLHPLC